MTLADAPISRLESFLTDSSMTRYVDTVVMRTGDGFRAASATGAVDFCEAPDGSIEILAEAGDHPLLAWSTTQPAPALSSGLGVGETRTQRAGEHRDGSKR